MEPYCKVLSKNTNMSQHVLCAKTDASHFERSDKTVDQFKTTVLLERHPLYPLELGIFSTGISYTLYEWIKQRSKYWQIFAYNLLAMWRADMASITNTNGFLNNRHKDKRISREFRTLTQIKGHLKYNSWCWCNCNANDHGAFLKFK